MQASISWRTGEQLLPIFVDRGAPFYDFARYRDLVVPVRILWCSFSRRTIGALPEVTHPNAAGLDDGEMAGPIVTRREQVAEPRSDIARIWHRHAK
jgi:hypothetical protein